MIKFVSESWLVLVMGAGFAALLAAAQVTFLPQIEANQRAALNTAIASVVPGGEAATERRKYVLEERIGGRKVSNEVYEVVADAGTLGWAVTADGPGFVDVIGLVVGLTPDLSEVTAINVIRSQETPGLGDKIKGEWANQFIGLNADTEIYVVKGEADGDANQIQAITGATYSAEYVADIVSDVLTRLRPKMRELQPADAVETQEQ
jgi:Na+-translocating ferredoxin:NAD+ oxidoreductase subunit G